MTPDDEYWKMVEKRTEEERTTKNESERWTNSLFD